MPGPWEGKDSRQSVMIRESSPCHGLSARITDFTREGLDAIGFRS
jgi:hypothetical protein